MGKATQSKDTPGLLLCSLAVNLLSPSMSSKDRQGRAETDYQLKAFKSKFKSCCRDEVKGTWRVV